MHPHDQMTATINFAVQEKHNLHALLQDYYRTKKNLQFNGLFIGIWHNPNLSLLLYVSGCWNYLNDIAGRYEHKHMWCTNGILTSSLWSSSSCSRRRARASSSEVPTSMRSGSICWMRTRIQSWLCNTHTVRIITHV